MPAGRPTKYRPEMCEVVVKSGAEGKTLLGMANDLDIQRETLNEWMKTHPEFSDAVKEGLQKSQAWWEDQGRIATFGGTKNFNPTSYIFNMKNRFPSDWREKQDVDLTSSDGTMTPQIIERVIVQPKDADA
jgi:hypothetical protein